MAKAKAKGDGKKGSRKLDGSKALERSPSHLLHRALQVALDIYAEEIGPDAVTQRQYAVLAAVAAHEGLTQTDLVRTTGIDRSTLADLVARMIGKSLLARQRSATDARANTVRLTDQGRAALDLASPRVAAADERILKLLPSRKRDAFLDVLKEMSHAAEQLHDEPEAAPKGKKKDKPGKAEKAAKAKAEKPVKPAKAEKPPKAEKPEKADKAKKPKKAAALETAGAA
ncbi:MarR family winged helix-turn-helix transcriptional regulator [Phenylobacterium montanum]|uniref:Winged helix-turn-helix transcriptional regulator n=1 Tax=Phenylobacterium montanum TaxID=2823693 RepID=A0A975FXG9_9CAUL|nr:MarR family winged helix-turn-helix transcriptional regulator [Caulobacter sp. S6]QUD87034.1 winged helix-turn-helix transcriptional regulator [Caulobacter sp. S6]